MNSELVTVFLGQFIGPVDRVDTDSIYQKAQWLVNHLFRKYRDDFYMPPVLRRERGEIFGLMRKPAISYQVCALFNEELHPAWVRFAIVRDAVEVPGMGRLENELVGKLVDRARHLLGKARTGGWCYVFDLGEETLFNSVLTEMTSLIHAFRNMWSDHQNKVILLYKELGRQKHVADRLGITQQAVSDILKRAHWREIKRAEVMIDRLLKEI